MWIVNVWWCGTLVEDPEPLSLVPYLQAWETWFLSYLRTILTRDQTLNNMWIVDVDVPEIRRCGLDLDLTIYPIHTEP
jgi:hypothetical protein